MNIFAELPITFKLLPVWNTRYIVRITLQHAKQNLPKTNTEYLKRNSTFTC